MTTLIAQAVPSPKSNHPFLRWFFLFLARKSAIFLAVDGKMTVPSRKEAFFMDEVRDICYICMIKVSS